MRHTQYQVRHSAGASKHTRISHLDENIAEDPELAAKARLQLHHAGAPAVADGVVFPSKNELVGGVELEQLLNAVACMRPSVSQSVSQSLGQSHARREGRAAVRTFRIDMQYDPKHHANL